MPSRRYPPQSAPGVDAAELPHVAKLRRVRHLHVNVHRTRRSGASASAVHVRCTAIGALLLAAACAPNPPPRWAEGGAPLVIGAARWERGDDDTVEILPNGQVLEGGDPIFLVDRAGRVVDEDYDPVAILLPDGFVAGLDNRLLGRIGVSNAAPPHSATAWLAVMPDGQVVFFDDDGERHNGGRWIGCEGARRRTCTLVTHIFVLRHYRDRDSEPRFGVGVGVGVGF